MIFSQNILFTLEYHHIQNTTSHTFPRQNQQEPPVITYSCSQKSYEGTVDGFPGGKVNFHCSPVRKHSRPRFPSWDFVKRIKPTRRQTATASWASGVARRSAEPCRCLRLIPLSRTTLPSLNYFQPSNHTKPSSKPRAQIIKSHLLRHVRAESSFLVSAWTEWLFI